MRALAAAAVGRREGCGCGQWFPAALGSSRFLQLGCALMLLALAPTATIAATASDLPGSSALLGKVVYLDFWASWCVPCRESFPWMNEMQREFGGEGLVVVAVNVDHGRADADRFLVKYPPGFRVVFDPEGTLAERFGVKGMPSSFLIDRSGNVRYEQEGFRLKERASLEQRIRSLIVTR